MDEKTIQNNLQEEFKAIYGEKSNAMTPVIMGYETDENGMICELSTDRIGYYGVTVVDNGKMVPQKNRVFFSAPDARKYMKTMFKKKGKAIGKKNDK